MPDREENGRIYLTAYHHSDITWMFSYEEYDEIRERQLNIVLDFFARYPQFTFHVDQAYVLHNYLQRNPERAADVQRLVAGGSGPFGAFGGYSIPDVNLCSGESFLRNFLLGQEYYRAAFGLPPQVASLDDAFGMPPQTPQMLALLGYTYLMPGRMPNARDGLDIDRPFVWMALGGREGVIAVPNGMGVGGVGYQGNLPVTMSENQRFAHTMAALRETEGDVYAYYVTEYQMLDEALFAHMEEANRRPGAGRQITFGRFADYCATLQKQALPVYQGEFNPVFTGLYTSRIGVKQKIRRAETALFGAELAGVLCGRGAELAEEWRQLALGQCHDAAAGCHHDVSNADVNEKLDFVIAGARHKCRQALGEGGDIVVVNLSAATGQRLVETTADALPEGLPVQQDGPRFYFSAALPPFGAASFAPGTAAGVQAARQCAPQGYRGETDCFAFDFSGVAPVIQSKRFSHNVFGQQAFGEILFRHESGTMWTECLNEPPYGSEYQDEAVTKVEEGPLFIKVTTEGQVKPGKTPQSGNTGSYWPGFGSLSFTKEYLFPRHLPYFKLRLTVDFTGSNTKLLLRVPVELNPLQATALYDTPFAAVARKPYFEVPCEYEQTMRPLAAPGDYNSAKGGYPALNWVDYCDDNIGLAVANNGTPGHQLVGKNIFISLLRSGTSCMNGGMYPQPGFFCNGTHTFEFAFADHLPGQAAEAPALGDVLNRAPLCARANAAACGGFSLAFSKPNILVSAIYQKAGGVLVRAWEAFGEETRCAITYTGCTACHSADVRGEALAPQNKDDVRFAPYEIRTFVLE